jgi:hypothetical protein
MRKIAAAAVAGMAVTGSSTVAYDAFPQAGAPSAG